MYFNTNFKMKSYLFFTIFPDYFLKFLKSALYYNKIYYALLT